MHYFCIFSLNPAWSIEEAVVDVEASEDDRSFDMAAPEFSAFSVDSKWSNAILFRLVYRL